MLPKLVKRWAKRRIVIWKPTCQVAGSFASSGWIWRDFVAISWQNRHNDDIGVTSVYRHYGRRKGSLAVKEKPSLQKSLIFKVFLQKCFFLEKIQKWSSNFDLTWCRAIDRRNESAFLKFFIFFLSWKNTKNVVIHVLKYWESKNLVNTLWFRIRLHCI